MSLVVAGMLLGYGINKMIEIDKKNESADKKNIKSFKRLAESKVQVKEYQKEAHDSVMRLANRKKGILITTIQEFLLNYETIMRIDFVEGEGIKELSSFALPANTVDEMKNMIFSASTPMSDRKMLGTFIFKGVIGLIDQEAEDKLRESNLIKKQADLFESQAETMVVTLEGIKTRAEKITDMITKLNFLFKKSLSTMTAIIEKNGDNRKLYTQEDKKNIMATVNFATTVKKILDSKLLDENGEITHQSLQALQIGEEYLDKVQTAIYL